MKKILIAAAFTAFAATPVFAQQVWTQGQYQQPAHMYAPAQSTVVTGPFVASGPYAAQPYAVAPGAYGNVAVSINGQIAGQDPDPGIRFDLERNAARDLGIGGSS